MSSLYLNSLLPLPPSHPHKLIEPSSSPSFLTTSNCNEIALRPIVINGDPPTFVSAPSRRIIAVGDLHGDLGKARDALQMAGVLSSDGRDHWTGQDTVNGNHETMNVEGDFRYVDASAFDECTDFLDYLEDYAHDWDKAFTNWVFESRQWKEDRRSSHH